MEEYIIVLLILAFAILVGSTLGFGDSLIFIPLAALFLDIHIAIVLMGFWTTIMSTFNSIKYRQYFDKVFIKKYIPLGIVGVILGTFLLVIAPIPVIELSLGIFIIIFIITKFREVRREDKEISIEKPLKTESELNELPKSILYSGSFSYGIVGGLIGTPGPINVVVLEKRGHERESFIGNFSIISIIVTSFRLVMYISYDLFPIDLIMLFLFGIILTYGVTKLGHWLTPKIPKKKFKFLILVLLAIIGLRLIINSTLFLFNQTI
ncbi:MAG: TSUP family transporter [Candidatus Hermodarchaeota archaeon]